MSYFKRTPIGYRYILITAGVLATLFLFQAYMHFYVYQDMKDMGEFNWWREAPVPYLNFLFWALLCPLVYSILRRWPFQGGFSIRLALIHLGFSLLIAGVHEIITSAATTAVRTGIGYFAADGPAYRSRVYTALVAAGLTRASRYWGMMGVLLGWEEARMRREEREQLLKLKNEHQISE